MIFQCLKGFATIQLEDSTYVLGQDLSSSYLADTDLVVLANVFHGVLDLGEGVLFQVGFVEILL